MSVKKNYGIPYMGSKNTIAEWVVSNLQCADTAKNAPRVFVDLFAGGCAVTHAALLADKYAAYFANDITDSVELFCEAINGRFRNETRWISREDFFTLKDTEPYIRYCWSFGNNGVDYMYSKEIEPWKKAYHFATVFADASLFAEMGIHIPKELFGKEGYDRKFAIGNWIRTHNEECKRAYVEWYKRTYFGKHDAEIEEIRANIASEEERLRQYLIDHLKKSGLKASDVNRITGTKMACHYYGKSQWQFPTYEVYEQLRPYMHWTHDYQICNYLEQRLQRLQSLQRLQRLQSLQSMESLQCLQRLQSMESLQRLQSLQRLTALRLDYAFAYEVVKKRTSEPLLVYCDPPYRGTAGYNGEEFDHSRFDDWAREQIARNPRDLFVFSEYNMPADFVQVASKEKINKLAKRDGKAIMSTEVLYVHCSQASTYYSLTNHLQSKRPRLVQTSLLDLAAFGI